MKQGWEIKKLGEISRIIYGYTEKASSEEVGPKFLRITDIQNGTVNWESVPYCNISDTDFEKYKLIDGDIVFARTGATTGKSYLISAPPKAVFASYLIKVHINNRDVCYEFLNFFFHSKSYWEVINKGISGSAQGGFNATKLSSLEIPLPPLPEQQRIVSILDKVFAAIDKAKANAEQNLKNACEVFDSYLKGVFEDQKDKWVYEKLGDVCDTGAGGTPLKNHKEYYEGGDIPWLRSGEVNKKDIIESELYITEVGLKNSSARLFPLNTVLIAMYGATAGQVGILRFRCSTNQAICGILPNSVFIAEFLYYKFIAGKELLVSQAVGGAQPNISQIKIKNTLVPIISIKEQQSIVNKLDALRAETQKLEAIYKKKLDCLEELKKSVLQKAFAGELIEDV